MSDSQLTLTSSPQTRSGSVTLTVKDIGSSSRWLDLSLGPKTTISDGGSGVFLILMVSRVEVISPRSSSTSSLAVLSPNIPRRVQMRMVPLDSRRMSCQLVSRVYLRSSPSRSSATISSQMISPSSTSTVTGTSYPPMEMMTGGSLTSITRMGMLNHLVECPSETENRTHSMGEGSGKR